MIFVILIDAIVIAITVFQMLQGSHTALAMAITSTVAACLAFETYEWLAGLPWLGGWMGPYAYGVCLLTSFAGVIFLIREAHDRLFPANIFFPVFIDRPIAALFGLYTGMLLAGMIAIGVQMLPFGPSVLGYDRVGLLTEPNPIEMKPVGYSTSIYRPFSLQMKYDVEDAAGISRTIWPFYADEFAFGVYKHLIENGASRESESRKAPRDYLGREIDANEFLARAWDWRVQARFDLTPVGLRIPLWKQYDKTDGKDRDSPAAQASYKKAAYDKRLERPTAKGDGELLRLLSVRRFTLTSYNRSDLTEVPINGHPHVLVTVEVPRGAGTRGWYLAPSPLGIRDGEFPPVKPDAIAKAVADGDAAEFFSFAYWQFKLFTYAEAEKKTGEREWHLRGVWGLEITQPSTDTKSGSKRTLKEAYKKQLRESRIDLHPPGNIAVLRFPARPAALPKKEESDEELTEANKRNFLAGEPLRFRLVFAVDEKLSSLGVILRYTQTPSDPTELADKQRRQELVWESRRQRPIDISDPVSVPAD
jgi:hypothetical protein